MGKYLIDNNVISNFFSGNFSVKGMDFLSDDIDQTPIISVITEIEAFSWINPDKNKEQIVNIYKRCNNFRTYFCSRSSMYKNKT